MSDFESFEGQITPITWGDRIYTILPLPSDVATALAPARRVEGEIADHPVNLAISKAPVVSGVFLWAGRSLLDRIGVEPGDSVEVRLRAAPDDEVDVPEDVTAALLTSGALTKWESMSPGKRRSALYQVSTARRAETRAKRIANLVRDVLNE